MTYIGLAADGFHIFENADGSRFATYDREGKRKALSIF